MDEMYLIGLLGFFWEDDLGKTEIEPTKAMVTKKSAPKVLLNFWSAKLVY